MVPVSQRYRPHNIRSLVNRRFAIRALKHSGYGWLAVVLFVVVTLAGLPSAYAQSNADYAAIPPFLGNAVTPNILILMDNSGSMGYRAACDDTTNQSSPLFNLCPGGGTFVESTTYSGLFDSMACYTYDAGNTRFVKSGAAKATISKACTSTLWDGNLLNWITFRRQDALKQALMGGQCAVARASDGTCPASGSPALITLRTEDQFNSTCCADVSTPRVQTGGCGTGCGDNRANGRVPTAVQTLGASPANLVFHARGTGTLAGSFCVANPTDGLLSSTTSCTISGGSGFTEQRFVSHLAVSPEPLGMIQQLGDKARFGLLEFRNTSDGGKVLVPIGSTQSTPYDTTTVTNYTSNKAAMTNAIEQTNPATNTPLAETLYTGIRYIAQLPQPYTNSAYLYPVAYSSGGPSFQAAQTAGGMGTTEITALSAGETCPAGYIAKACGRDPFFYGSNPAPGWATPSRQVNCCKTFVIILTDGAPTTDTNIPAALKDYAHIPHGKHCTGSSSAVPPPSGTCFTSNTVTIPPATLLQQHKTDYDDGSLHSLDDVAYWAHITDLRQATIPVINEAGHDLPGMQNVTVYTFFAFGNINGREILMQAAKQGGFEDQNANNLPDLQSEWDRIDNATGLLAPDGIPDTYFESSNADDIGTKLLTAFTSILQRASSGTSVSVLASSTTGQGMTYQAYFYPSTLNTLGNTSNTVTWTGYLQGLFVDQYGNLREDYSGPGCTGSPDGKLVLTHDCIIKIRVDPATHEVVVDRYKDDNGDGMADSTTPYQTVTLKDIQAAWEAGRRLALTDPGDSCAANTGGVTCRRLLTWVDRNNDGLMNSGEWIEFSTAGVATLCPYLGGANVAACVSGGSGGTGQTEATNLINWIRGIQVTGLRDRQLNVIDDSGTPANKVWKLGDIVYSSPVVVSAPSERYDIIYGDATYADFFKRYKDRRQVAYVGANDGMLHAFNGGFFSVGDDHSTVGAIEQVRFTTTPKQPGTSSDCAALPCDASAPTYAYRSLTPKLGAELWGFIPQDLLPQLRWLASPSYSHVYYVDLKPKVTDARIFAADADHPGGWGTILIGGFRMGGSCSTCPTGIGQARVVTADFDSNGNTTSAGDTRAFLSSYFVLDVTNPEKDPVLLWTFRDIDLGFTASVPAVLRVNPASDTHTSSANEKWYAVFGTGPNTFSGVTTGVNSSAKLFVVDLKQGPAYKAVNQTTGTVNGHNCGTGNGPNTSPCIAADTTGVNKPVRAFDTGQRYAFMGDIVTLDSGLDFSVDVVYAGAVICNGTVPTTDCIATGAPTWKGALYRLTTNHGNTDPTTWGSGASGAPTTVVSSFAYTSASTPTCSSASPCPVGPIASAPALTVDTNQNLWLFFGTGRYYAATDSTNTDIQHFFGVKDSYITQGTPAQTTERNNLYNVSHVTVCTSCTSSANVSYNGGSSFTAGFDTGANNLVGNIQNIDGWFLALPGTGERSLSVATLLSGSVYFTTFVPSSDMCVGSGTGYLYGLYYLTGTPSPTSALAITPVGSNSIGGRSLSVGNGVAAHMAPHIGGAGAGQAGTASNNGCNGRVTGFIQSSNGALQQVCSPTPSTSWSRMIAWRDL